MNQDDRIQFCSSFAVMMIMMSGSTKCASSLAASWFNGRWEQHFHVGNAIRGVDDGRIHRENHRKNRRTTWYLDIFEIYQILWFPIVFPCLVGSYKQIPWALQVYKLFGSTYSVHCSVRPCSWDQPSCLWRSCGVDKHLSTLINSNEWTTLFCIILHHFTIFYHILPFLNAVPLLYDWRSRSTFSPQALQIRDGAHQTPGLLLEPDVKSAKRTGREQASHSPL